MWIAIWLFSQCYEEMKVAGIQVSKQIFMALINAYATCGQFEKAKQVSRV
jgi:hypothetical protein